MNESWEDGRDPLAALRRGSPALFEAFVRAEIATFLGFYARLGARRAEAEDLVQDLFVKLYERSSEYQPQGSFGAFAFRVARNLWMDHGRRQASRPTGALADADERALRQLVPEGQTGPLEELERDEDFCRLQAAIARLPEPHRLVFELGALQGLPYQSVGDALGLPVGTVKSRMFHAVRKLRAALGFPEGSEEPAAAVGRAAPEGSSGERPGGGAE